jgi:hypothetical protein
VWSSPNSRFYDAAFILSQQAFAAALVKTGLRLLEKTSGQCPREKDEFKLTLVT